MSKDVFAKSGNYGAYPPPSLDQVIMFPGYDGGMEWGGSAADPDGILYVNVNEMPWFYQLVPTKEADGSALPYGERHYRVNCASCHGMDRKGNPAGGFPSLHDVSKRLTREMVMKFMEIGGGRMPAFDRLSGERRQAIVDFLFDDESTANRQVKNDKVVSQLNVTDPHVEGISELNREDEDPPYVFRGFQRWLDDEGYPAIKPPWGTLNAVDLNTGTIKWKVPLGEYEELTKRGTPITGTENYGGPIVTAGGLVFIGATADAKFRAFDKTTGEILWEGDLPMDGNATPSTYVANGKQYVVISTGGAKMKPLHLGTLIAFTLPD